MGDRDIPIYTSWVNSHLAQSGVQVDDLLTGFRDGLKLIQLVENLTKKTIEGKVHRPPKNRNQEIDNCKIAVDFVQKNIDRPLRDIDGNDIASGAKNATLGLIFALRRKFGKQDADGSAAAVISTVAAAGAAINRSLSVIRSRAVILLEPTEVEDIRDIEGTFSAGKRFVQAGRIAVVVYGALANKLAVIVDIIDDKRVLVDIIGEIGSRQTISNRRLKPTGLLIPIARGISQEQVASEVERSKVVQKFATTSIGKKIASQEAKYQLTDFQRFKYDQLVLKRIQLFTQLQQ